jgi:phage portal protein BeeE
MAKKDLTTEVRIGQPKGGVFSQIGSWFNSLFSRTTWRTLFTGQREVLPDITARTAVTEGYEKNAAVYAIIETDAEKFASIPRYVVDAKLLQEKKGKLPLKYKDYTKQKQVDGALSKLIDRPNPMQGQAAFFRTVRAFYKTCGEAFIWLNRGDIEGKTDTQIALMPVLEMYVLPSYLVKVIPDPDNIWGVLGYILQVSGQDLPLKKVDVIHWKSTNLGADNSLRDMLRGMPALKPGAGALQQNNDATLGSVRMIQNDGAKGALFAKTLGTPPQETQVRSVIDRKINNNDMKGAVAALQGDWGYVDLGKTSIDLQLLEAKQWSWKELCAVLGPPYQLFDPSVTYANLEFAQKNWITNKMIPASKELDDELNRVLLRAFAVEGALLIVCDYSELPELQEDMAKMTVWLKDAYWITPNQKLEMQGYEKRPEPEFDEPWMPSGIMPLSKVLEDDGFDDMANELGLSDYAVKPPKENGQPVNGQLNGQGKK